MGLSRPPAFEVFRTPYHFRKVVFEIASCVIRDVDIAASERQDDLLLANSNGPGPPAGMPRKSIARAPRRFSMSSITSCDHEMLVQDFERADSRACARPADADLSSQGGGDHTRCGGTGSDPHAGVGAAGHGASQVGAVSEGAAIAEAPTRISGSAQARLGAALVSAALFLGECGRGGRGNDQEIH